jgi:D-alanyl-D-alanine carboxypeptidase
MPLQVILLIFTLAISLFFNQFVKNRDYAFFTNFNQASFAQNVFSPVGFKDNTLEQEQFSILNSKNEVLDLVQKSNAVNSIVAISTTQDQKKGKMLFSSSDLMASSIDPLVLSESISYDTEQKNDQINNDVFGEAFQCFLKESPKITAKSFFVQDLYSNQTVLGFNILKRWPVASLTKLMTSVVVLENLDAYKKVNISQKAVDQIGAIGNFKEGEIFQVQDLIKAMLLISSNDAAFALLEAIGETNFKELVSKKVQELQMYNTNLVDSSGLSFLNQSTARDLAKLVNYIFVVHPNIWEISRLAEANIKDFRSGKSRKIVTINNLVRDVGFFGGKTGYIHDSGRNLIALFDINGRKLVFILLGSEDVFQEARLLKKIVQQCQ